MIKHNLDEQRISTVIEEKQSDLLADEDSLKLLIE